ncbi:MAG: hypothetical protein EBU54_09110 [Mycobacteriaceae bacterium]|nr:hypothetical protein [Mycobacteriaceae bacterium]
MNSDTVLIFLSGGVVGGAVGYLQAWRLARRLEYFRVSLERWQFDDVDQPRRTALRVARDA